MSLVTFISLISRDANWKNLEKESWSNHKASCGLNALATVKQDPQLAEADAIYGRNTGRRITLPLEDIYPLLQDFVVTYRGLMLLAMTNAFGWASGPPHFPQCTDAQPGKVLYITLSTIPDISPSTKAKSAFRVKDAEAISLESFRDAVTNRQHPLYETENKQLVESYDQYVSQMCSYRGSAQRISMCVLKLDFHNGVRRFMYFKNWYFADDPMRNYSAQWNPVNWLEYFKEMVAKGKGWHRNDVNFS